VPILIHLINRMRFKRIRWAAMEFLLKSQKRNRRRLIIEQIILLLLRCLLVVLAALLVARFVGCAAHGTTQNTTLHYVVLDDTLSMTDQWKDQGAAKTAFDEGKRLIKEIAKNAAQAGAAQQLKLVRLSDPGDVLFDDRLNDQTVNQLTSVLDDLKPSELHVKPQAGLLAAREVFGQNAVAQRVLHFVSDFRSQDWSGPESEALNQEIDGICQMGVQVYLVDTADPARGPGTPVPLHHDNLGITDLRAETRVAAKNMPVQFTVSVMNFGKEEQKGVFLTVRINGVESLAGSQPIPSLPANTLTNFTFSVAFQQEGFNQLTASLPPEDTGIQADNKRFAVIEVRAEVEVLMIDGNGAQGLKPGGDTFYLQTVLTSARGYKVVPRGVEELDKPNLEKYPSIFLLNVQEISDKGLKNLEDYVKAGGNISIFLGDKVRASYYNKVLYRDGKGLFPVPLSDRPTEPLTDDQKLEKLLVDEGQKLFLRNKHPIFADLFAVQPVFRYLIIDRYWPALRRDKWNPETGTVEELATLPNEKKVENYRGMGNDLANELQKIIDDPDAKYEKYRPGLKRHHAAIRDALGGEQLYVLASSLEALLSDKGNTEKPDPQHPNLEEFWQLPEQQNLRKRLDEYREVVQYGDPLVLTKRFGKGNVVAFLTTAGKAWNKWPGGCPASPTYPIVMMELQKYLTSSADDINWTVCTPLHLTSGGQDVTMPVGSPLHLELDATRYQAKIHRYYQPEAQELQPGQVGTGAQPTGDAKHSGLEDKGEQLGSSRDGKVHIIMEDARKPGVYLIDLFPVPADSGAEPKPETRAYAYNVDTLAEGELKRAAREELEHNPASAARDRGLVHLYNAKSDFKRFTARQSDLSESPWLFLVILLVLIVEQALAMHLSFHLKGNEAQLPSQVLRPHSTAA
jgi:hypothetical protein